MTEPDVAARRFGVALRTRPRNRALLAGVVAGIVLWQLLSLLVGATTEQGQNVVPPLQKILTSGITG